MAPSFPPVKACIFDMDGLLLNTEDLYTQVTNELLHKYGKPPLPWSIKARLQGRPFRQAHEIFDAWAQLPVENDVYFAEVAALQKQYFPSCAPLPGVLKLLETLTSAGVHVAMATSSHSTNFALKTSHLPELLRYFPENLRVKGDDPRVADGRGKPAPDIFLVALEAINDECRRRGTQVVRPEECLGFEDSVLGVESIRRAGMRAIWVPHPGLLEVMRDRVAEVLAGRGEEREPEKQDELDGRVNGLEQQTVDGLRGWPGKLDDGWGEVVQSLEDFDVAKYGIMKP